MREADVKYLVCPGCQGNLIISSVASHNGKELTSGHLRCVNCEAGYPIVGGIPRFVPLGNYAASFGLEWNIHAKTQYDSYSGLKISETRFFEETRWPRDLAGQTILEVGSGSGRFTEQAASTGAFVVSMDYSNAVEANYQSHRNRKNVLIVQADIYQMPFRRNFFDKLFCIGVLQHTPDIKKAFLSLPPMLCKGGELVIDVYNKSFFYVYFQPKYYIRPFIQNIKSERLYHQTKRWIDLWWPLCCLIRKIPVAGPSFNSRVLGIADCTALGLNKEQLKQWAYLDTFDSFSPRYDFPQKINSVRSWFQEAGLHDVNVKYGYNGIEGKGKV